MDVTPNMNDSGYITSTSSSAKTKRILHFPSCESTPSTSRPRSRKRKSEPFENKTRKLSNILEDKNELSPISTSLDSTFNRNSFNNNSVDLSKFCSEIPSFCDISFIKGNFKNSSPVNNKSSDDFKLSSSLEKCTLDDVIESQHSLKKYKWDDEEVSCDRKSNSAPGTPQRQQIDSEHSLRKYFSLDLTPTKGTNVKIGTPERLEILYPKLVEVKSPSKIRSEIKRLTKPARKRLFQCRDFVDIFTNVTKVNHVIKRIFSYLSDTDLVNVAKVSKLWKKSLESDQEAYKRYKSHLWNITISKENIYEFVSPLEKNKSSFTVTNIRKESRLTRSPARSPPRSPSRVNWMKFTKVAATLNGAQRLTKCAVCERPAIVERKLARCSGPNCGWLWCVRCLRGSNTPEDLACVCQGPHSPPQSPPLADKSNVDSLYFMDRSSGYFSHSDGEKSLSFCDKPKVLTDCNDNFPHGRKLSLEAASPPNNNNNVSILEHSAVIQKAKKTLWTKKKVAEPGSPQKVKMYAAGSKQSKRNLRRL